MRLDWLDVDRALQRAEFWARWAIREAEMSRAPSPLVARVAQLANTISRERQHLKDDTPILTSEHPRE